MRYASRLYAFVIAGALIAALAPIVVRVSAQRSGNAASGSLSASASLPSFGEPALSPDRSEVAFVSGGDIWTAPLSGGEARLLVSHAATESRPIYSPDGGRLAFISNRTGNGDIYVLTFATGDLQRLTFDDGLDQLDAWSRDGRWIYFSSTSRDIAGMNDIFRVNAQGGTPMQVSADRYVNEFFAAPSPDGAGLAFTARGIASGQWWRNGHSHIDESEIWLMRDINSPASYERLTERGAKEMWPMWGADGQTIFYMSDRSGAENIWARAPGRAARQVTQFRRGRALWPSISADGRTIVFERDFRIWRLDTSNGQASEIPITLRGASAAPAVERLRLNDQIQEIVLSPDGRKIAFVVRGEIFAAAAREGGDAARVTNTPAPESQITWAPDSQRIVYVSDRDGMPHLYLYNFATNTETQLTSSANADHTPQFAPDGRLIAFGRDGRELRVIDPATRQERLLATGALGRPPVSAARPFVWSPDSRWLAYMATGERLFTNASIVAAAGGGAARPVSFLSNVGSNTISWSPDGTFLLLDTGQRTESGQLARVDLIPRTPRFREDQFRDLFREESPRTTPAPDLPRPETRPEAPRETPTPAPTATPEASPSPTPTPSPEATPGSSPAPAASPRPGAAQSARPAPRPVAISWSLHSSRSAFEFQ